MAIVHYLNRNTTSLKPSAQPAAGAPGVMEAATRPVAPAQLSEPQAVKLDVRRYGQALRLTWDPSAAAVRDATHATLHIQDGRQDSQLELDSNMVHAGVLSYWPETRNVGFRMELFSPDQNVSASIRSVNGTAVDAGLEPVAPRPRRMVRPTTRADRADREDLRPSPFTSPQSAKPAPTPARPVNTAPASAARAVEVPSPTPSSARPAASSSAIREEVMPLPPPPPRTSDATEVKEPSRGSRLGKVAGKIPLLRRLVKHPPADSGQN